MSGDDSVQRAAPDDDVRSVFSATTEFRNMNKYEKALARYPEAWCWNPNGASMADALTQMRRCKTQAFNEKNELYPKLSERYDRMLHISECSLSPMLAADIVDTRHHIEAVVDSKTNQTMPKKNFMDWCCRHGAAHCLPLFGPANWDNVFKHIAIYKTQEKADYNLWSPVARCSHFQEADLQGGWAMKGFIQFIEGHVLPGILSHEASEANTKQVLAEAAGNIIVHCQAYPSEYFQHEIFTDFISRMKAIVLLFGRVPFQHGSKIEDVQKLINGEGHLLESIKEVPWAAKELNLCFMRNAGEVDSKPDIDAAAKLLDSDSGDQQAQGIKDVISSYTSWSLQVRKSWLEDMLQGRVARILSQEVKAACESVEANPAAPMNTPTNLQLVAFLKDISTLWSDVRLSMLVHQLSMVTSAIDRQEAVSTFVDAIKQALPKLAVDDASVFKEACGQVTASLPLRSMSLVLTAKEDLDKAVELMDALMARTFRWLPTGCGVPLEVSTLLSSMCDRVALEFEPPQPVAVLGDEKDDEAIEGKEQEKPGDAMQLYATTTKECKYLVAVVQLQLSHSEYQALGGTEHARFTNDKAHDAMELVINHKSTMEAESKNVMAGKGSHVNEAVLAYVGELLAGTDTQIKGHQKLFIAEAQPPLTEAMEALGKIAHGPDGKQWRELLSEAVPGCTFKTATKMTWSDFEAQTKDTLQKVQTRELITAIFQTHKAVAALSERYNRFGDKMDEETEKAATALLHSARITLQETFFVEAILKAKEDIDAATTDLQTHVANMQALPEASRIKPSELWPLVWTTALSVQSGTVPS